MTDYDEQLARARMLYPYTPGDDYGLLGVADRLIDIARRVAAIGVAAVGITLGWKWWR